MQIFFSEHINDNEVILDKVESHHCIHVLRKIKGDIITVIDGKGSFIEAEIIYANAKQVTAQIKAIIKEEITPPHLHIAIAPTKNMERFEWFLEKATELGIDEITPMICRHSERRNLNEERCHKILLSAIKQSGKAMLPKLNSLMPFEKFITEVKAQNKFIAHCYPSEKTTLKDVLNSNDILLAIGPEGDFNLAEVDTAKQNGFKDLSLGKSRLRTETAGVYVCAVLNASAQ